MTVEVLNDDAKSIFLKTEIKKDDTFDIRFKFLEDEELVKVSLRFQDDTTQELELDSDYSIDYSGGLNNVWGVVTIKRDFDNLKNICIYREIPLSQERQFSSQTVFAQTVEGALDKLTMLLQDLQSFLERCVSAPVDDVLADGSLQLPPVSKGAGYIVRDSMGNLDVKNIKEDEQSDWNEQDYTKISYIKNKPIIKDQEQASWTETDTTKPSYIKNKPNIIDNLNSDSTTDVLSANQGKVLNETKQDVLTAGSGIGLGANELSKQASHIEARIGNGLKFDTNGRITVNAILGLFVSKDGIYVRVGDGLTINAENDVMIRIGEGLEFTGNLKSLTLKKATTTSLGGVIPDGETITVNDMGKITATVKEVKVIDNLDSTSVMDALSANMGRMLYELASKALSFPHNGYVFPEPPDRVNTVFTFDGTGKIELKKIWLLDNWRCIRVADTESTTDLNLILPGEDKRKGKVVGFAKDNGKKLEMFEIPEGLQVVDSLEDSSTGKALSANMGKTLNETKQDKFTATGGIKLENGNLSLKAPVNDTQIGGVKQPSDRKSGINIDYDGSIWIKYGDLMQVDNINGYLDVAISNVISQIFPVGFCVCAANDTTIPSYFPGTWRYIQYGDLYFWKRES